MKILRLISIPVLFLLAGVESLAKNQCGDVEPIKYLFLAINHRPPLIGLFAWREVRMNDRHGIAKAAREAIHELRRQRDLGH